MRIKYVQIFKGQERKTFKTFRDCAEYLGTNHQKVKLYADDGIKLDGYLIRAHYDNGCEVCGALIKNPKEIVCSNKCYSISVTGREPIYNDLGQAGESEVTPRVRGY